MRMRRVAIPALMALVFLGLAEAALRVWAYNFRHSYQTYDAEAGMIRLVANYDHAPGGQGIRVNSKGFRGREFAKEKSDGVYRIFNLGDSATFGEPLEDCYYSVKLERLLNQRASGEQWEVINGGVQGYNSRDVLAVLGRDIPQYQPDMVTIMVGWNDLMKHDPGNPGRSERFARLAYATYDVYLVKFWRKLLYFYLRPAIASVQTSWSDSERDAYEDYVPVVFEDNVRRMIAVARHNGIRVVLITRPSVLAPDMTEGEMKILHFPHYTYNLQKLLFVHQRYNDSIRRLGTGEGVPVLDLELSFAGRRRHFYDTMHFDCEGHELVAQELARFLRSLDLGHN